MSLAKIKIIATGGTIAGSSSSATDLTNYSAAELSIQSLLDAVPQIHQFSDVSGEQLCNINSSSITLQIWLQLANRINELLCTEDVDGIVVTHGTDTLEETAYFLNLTVKSSKPVVITGAMRPATAISADGPLNLLNAVQLAASTTAIGKGVLVLLNGEINAAAEVAKTNSLAVQTFCSPMVGSLGCMIDENPVFWRTPTRRHTINSIFDIRGLKTLPYVKTIYGQAADDRLLVDAVVSANAQGIVFAGMGNGNIHESTEPALQEAVSKGIAVVIASRTGSGFVTENKLKNKQHGFIYSANLSPAKARILLMLALTITKDNGQIKEFFTIY